MLHYRAVAKTQFRKICDVALCIFGLVVMGYTTTLTVLNWINTDESVPVPKYCDGR